MNDQLQQVALTPAGVGGAVQRFKRRIVSAHDQGTEGLAAQTDIAIAVGQCLALCCVVRGNTSFDLKNTSQITRECTLATQTEAR